MENPEPRSQYLNAVLRQVERTALRIPKFQRDFVWGQRDILDLLESIEKGYPIGSILTWRVERSDGYFAGFRTNPFPPPDAALSAFEVVLDGAQRLSSLYGCLRNPGAGPQYVVSYDPRNQVFLYPAEARHAEPDLVPMDSLFDSRKFLDVQSRLSKSDGSDELLRRALGLYSTFQEYQIPIIALSNAALEDVVEVFRRVNSSGTPLSPVDFVRALTWRGQFDLQETFDEFAERYQATPLEGVNEDFLIKCLAITSGLSLDARDVIRLKTLADRPGALNDEVDAMRIALDKMGEFLLRFRVRAIDEVPYEVQRLVLFAIMHLDVEVPDERIETWFWRSTFAEEHQSRPDSYTSRLIRELRRGDVEPALSVRRPIDPDLLATRARRTGTAVTVGFNLLLRRLGARSLLSGARVEEGAVLHGLLYERDELEDGDDGFAVSPQVLANVAQLTSSDAARWSQLRREGLRLADMYAECEERTGDAEAVWRSQGLQQPGPATPAAVLHSRSVRLLSEVIEGVADQPLPNTMSEAPGATADQEPPADEPSLPSL